MQHGLILISGGGGVSVRADFRLVQLNIAPLHSRFNIPQQLTVHCFSLESPFGIPAVDMLLTFLL